MTQLSEHFSVAEFSTDSPKAKELGIDNSIPQELAQDALKTALMAERVRAQLSEEAGHDVPMKINSAYRSLLLNRAIGSKDTSDHLKMLAIDFVAPAFGTPLEVARALVPHMDAIGIGQVIYERGWCHISRRSPDKAVNKIITLAANGKDFLVGLPEVA